LTTILGTGILDIKFLTEYLHSDIIRRCVKIMLLAFKYDNRI
jgi:hypothetical protein